MNEFVIVTGIATIASAVFALLAYLRQNNKSLFFSNRPPWIALGTRRDSKNSAKRVEISKVNGVNRTEALLEYFWSYPFTKVSRNFAEQSWAVKESLVLKGDIPGARERPGLGSSIQSVEFALAVFGETAADGRISQVVNWAMQRVSKTPPHMLIDEIFYPQDSTTEKVEDFRHTLAFAVILAMTGRLPSYREEYLLLTLKSQRGDGGWDAGRGTTVSELLTVLYAVLFLGTCLKHNELKLRTENEAINSMTQGLAWIVKAKSESNLWHTDILKDYSWGAALTSALVLRGMSILGDISNEAWIECAQGALDKLIAETLEETCWKGTELLQKFRVETRIAAALAQTQPIWVSSSTTRDQVNEYLRGWRIRATMQLSQLPDSELDLSTVMYVLDSICTREELRVVAKRILEKKMLTGHVS